MKIDDISIERSSIMPGQWVLRISSRGARCTLHFDDLLTFMDAVAGAIKYFGQVWGLINVLPGGVVETKVKK